MAEHLMALELATRMALVGLEVEPDWCLVLICRAIRGVARAFGRSAWLRVLGLCLSRRFQNSNLLCKSEGIIPRDSVDFSRCCKFAVWSGGLRENIVFVGLCGEPDFK